MKQAVPVELKTKHEEPVEHVSERFLQDSRWMLNGYNVKELNEDTYHTPNMVAGLMVGLTAVTIFFCGYEFYVSIFIQRNLQTFIVNNVQILFENRCCCLASVTTPREFADKPLNIAKEW